MGEVINVAREKEKRMEVYWWEQENVVDQDKCQPTDEELKEEIDMNNNEFDEIMRAVMYWQEKANYVFGGKENLMRLYGQAQMAYRLKAITFDQFMVINENTIAFMNNNK